MNYEIDESLESLSFDSDKKIGEFYIRRNNDFILFKPSINYKGQSINRLKIQHSTFKHLGPRTLKYLFEKFIPGLIGRNYEETLHPEYNEVLPSTVFLSTLAGDPFPNYDTKKDKEYNPKTQFRSHNLRVCNDHHGPYLDWFHLSPIREKQYKAMKTKQSKEQDT
ncbi:hypothetical protein ACFL6W_03470 [Thermodesulfobacteriota bacterium]